MHLSTCLSIINIYEVFFRENMFNFSSILLPVVLLTAGGALLLGGSFGLYFGRSLLDVGAVDGALSAATTVTFGDGFGLSFGSSFGSPFGDGFDLSFGSFGDGFGLPFGSSFGLKLSLLGWLVGWLVG